MNNISISQTAFKLDLSASRIACSVEHEDQLKIIYLNLANAERDTDFAPLYNRLQNIINLINLETPDCVVFIEACRPSKKPDGTIISWSSMIGIIEDGINLKMRQVTVKHNNSTVNPFGFSILARPNRVYVHDVQQLMLCPNGFGSFGLKFTLSPVVDDNKINLLYQVNCVAVHLPMNPNDRIIVCNNLIGLNEIIPIDLLFGDFNTFCDDNGPTMLELLQSKFKSVITDMTIPSFYPFPHDPLIISKDKLKYFDKYILLDENIETNIVKIQALSRLDHCFTSTNKYSVECQIYNQEKDMNKLNDMFRENTRISDHFPLIIICHFV
jgi:hypothetical protein